MWFFTSAPTCTRVPACKSYVDLGCVLIFHFIQRNANSTFPFLLFIGLECVKHPSTNEWYSFLSVSLILFIIKSKFHFLPLYRFKTTVYSKFHFLPLYRFKTIVLTYTVESINNWRVFTYLFEREIKKIYKHERFYDLKKQREKGRGIVKTNNQTIGNGLCYYLAIVQYYFFFEKI